MQAAIARGVRWLIVIGLIAMSAASNAAISATPLLETVPATASWDIQQQSNEPRTTATTAVAEGLRLLDDRQFEAARQQFERALVLARAETNREAEGGAYRGIGAALLNLSKYPAAKEALDRALEIFDITGSPADLGRVHRDLGTVEYFLNHIDAARSHYVQALARFEASGDVTSQAAVCNSLTFVTDDNERIEFTTKGLELARRAGAVETEARLLHSWSDFLFARGRLVEATENLELAIARFEAAGDKARANFARALTSLGRLHRAHGQYAQALAAYQRAFQIQQALGDRSGMIQSLNTIAGAYIALGKRRGVRPILERALALATETGSPLIIDFQRAALAQDLIETSDDPVHGVEILQDVVSRDPNRTSIYSGSLARGYLILGQYSRAVEAADLAISQARAHDLLDQVQQTYDWRAQAYERLGKYSAALADAREAIALVERVRTEAIPTDSMKRGFAEQHQWLFTHVIQLLHHLGRGREALETAEQARGRAFADLLASRERTGSNGSESERSESTADPDQSPVTVSKSRELQTRGSETGGSGVPRLRSPRDLASLASVAPLSSSQLVDVAARLHSTIVSYWVAPDATYVWVIRSSGEIAAERIAVTERRLTELVRQTWMTGNASLRGEVASDQIVTSEPSVTAEIRQPDEAWTPRLRGDGLLSFSDAPVVALGALHKLLVAPIQRLLPTERGSLLTIVPHGPLFRLSFAALRSPSGQYLVERYAIHYVPAGVVLDLAEQNPRASIASDRRYLLIADPQTPPALPDGKPLPRLPGTRREVSEVAALVPASRVTSLVGVQATEDRVRQFVGDRDVIHFATHGVIRADDPLESFLALETSAVRSQRGVSDADGDGRLTAREIYSIQMHANLVVLSACRSGLGEISGDGVMGLARAFLYAGTPSVIATLWDVADEPAARLMPNLYRSLKRVPDNAQALRRAQLTLLGDLRNGRVKVETKAGTAILAEHPILWASFILVGKP